MKRASLMLLLVGTGCGHLPVPPPASYAIEAVTFNGSGFRPVELDGYGTALGPHWPVRSRPPLVAEDVPEYYRLHGAPIAYLAGSVPGALLRARVPAEWQGEVVVQARGGGWLLEGRGQALAGELTAEVTATRALPAVVMRVAGWQLRWQARHGGRSLDLGVSSAHLYVLLAEPQGPLLHTPLELAAVHARGAAHAEAVVDGVWSAFARHDVRRARDGRPLRYYGEYLDGAPPELRRLLVSGTGQCVAWSHLLYAALAAHGIESHVVRVLPPAQGLLFIAPWRFIEGTLFIDAGPNGVAETDAAGDDVAYIGRGRGMPHGRIWTPPPLPIGRLAGDDTLAYMVGRNGLADSFTDTTLALPLLARGFGLEQQRAWRLEPDAVVTPGGDDVIASLGGERFVLTGANGVLETAPAPGMHPAAGWTPVVGAGSTASPVQTALPRAWPLAERGGDDREYGWILTTGPDGISQTRGALAGRGAPHAVVVGAGPNGRLESVPGGDDRVLDLAELLRAAPEGHRWLPGITMWPQPGAGAQQNGWPPAQYPSHVLLRVGDAWYDPSYGRGPFASPLEWERALLAGVGAPVDPVLAERVGTGGLQVVRRGTGDERLTRSLPEEPPR